MRFLITQMDVGDYLKLIKGAESDLIDVNIKDPLCTVKIDDWTLTYKANWNLSSIETILSDGNFYYVLGRSDEDTYRFYSILHRHVLRDIANQLVFSGGEPFKRLFRYFKLRRGPPILKKEIKVVYVEDEIGMKTSDEMYAASRV
jgi:hypothetical protein